MPAEVIAFSELFDAVSSLCNELGAFLKTTVPVQLFTDKKCLIYIISKRSNTSENRTTLVVEGGKEAFESRTISDIALVSRRYNISDGLAESMSQSLLRTFIEQKILN